VLGRPFVKVDRAKIFELHAAANGVLKISRALTTAGMPVSRETVRRIIKGQVYPERGELCAPVNVNKGK
jgi:hypothetical protein